MLGNHPTAALCSWLNWFLFNSNKTFCLKACNSFCYTICGFSIIGAIINFLELPKEAVKNKRNHKVIVRGVVIEELIHTWLACIEFRGGEWGNLGGTKKRKSCLRHYQALHCHDYRRHLVTQSTYHLDDNLLLNTISQPAETFGQVTDISVTWLTSWLRWVDNRCQWIDYSC